MLNLLTKRLININADGQTHAATLPEVYAKLMADEVDSFPALRPHQRHAWHAFLVQLGAMALHHVNPSKPPAPPATAAEWCALIRGLTPDYPNDEPWQLVVEDITQPAFMQPPASAPSKLAEYKSAVETPDELDLLVTSKNHDLKSAVATQTKEDDWIFALITLQTMAGYDGSKTYGISRMPSGYGNRPAFSITPSTRPGIHIQRDMMALLEYRAVLLDRYEMTDAGIGLVWTVQWDGKPKEALLPGQLEPFYIEICRRIRLNWQGRRLAAIRASSDFRRIIDVKGRTGDPWIPINKKTNPRGTPPAFLGPRKFGYERVMDGLTSPDWEQPYFLRPLQSERDSSLTMQLVARGMVRGEGGTEGYHERIIPLRPKVVAAFGRAAPPKTLGVIARERIEQVSIVRGILRHAVSMFASGGNTDNLANKIKSRAIDIWVNKLDEIVDTTFFDALQTEFEEDDPGRRKQIRNEWLKNDNDGVIDQAWRILQDAEDSLPGPAIQRYKARVCADSVFEGRIEKELPCSD